jgi:hypothetical protein
MSPYWTKKSFLDTKYGIRQVGNTYMIGDQIVSVDPQSNIHIESATFPGTKGLWELLTRKKVNKKFITADDLQRDKEILEMTNANLEGYSANVNINVSRGQVQGRYFEALSRCAAEE